MTETDSAVPTPSVRTLPASVRTVIVNWAADALGELPPEQIPLALARVARFTPGKRARLGAAVLAQTVDSDAGFRAAVAERARSAVPLHDPSADPVDPGWASATPRDAAAAHLLRLPTEEALLTALGETGTTGGHAEAAELHRALRQVRRELGRVTAERDEARRHAAPAGNTDDEVEKLRRRLRDQGTRLRQAETAVQSSIAVAQEELGSLRREVHRLTGEVTRWQERTRAAVERADRAQESLGRLREQAGLHKATADRRLDLLLSTVEGAVSGLRREWDLIGGGVDPADVVAGRMPGSGATPESTGEPSRLNTWLSLPAAHLIVDGYNVSKTGYPDLTLAQQRDRLVRVLAALASRTSAEVTVVFDGSAVAVPAPPGRGIRVLFSPPGVIADDVIRDLVAAEPAGRVVIVVSSDREVAEGVRRRGARTAGSDVLLALTA